MFYTSQLVEKIFLTTYDSSKEQQLAHLTHEIPLDRDSIELDIYYNISASEIGDDLYLFPRNQLVFDPNHMMKQSDHIFHIIVKTNHIYDLKDGIIKSDRAEIIHVGTVNECTQSEFRALIFTENDKGSLQFVKCKDAGSPSWGDVEIIAEKYHSTYVIGLISNAFTFESLKINGTYLDFNDMYTEEWLGMPESSEDEYAHIFLNDHLNDLAVGHMCLFNSAMGYYADPVKVFDGEDSLHHSISIFK